MRIKLQNGRPALEEDIASLQAALGCSLSHSFRSFLRAYDGARPETNIFRVSDKNDSGVNEFIPVCEILKVRARLDNIPGRAYPVARAEGGNHVVVDEGRNGTVYFGRRAPGTTD